MNKGNSDYYVYQIKIAGIIITARQNFIFGKKKEVLNFMIKKSFISIILHEEKEENMGSIEFQVFHFSNKIGRLTSHLELHEKNYSSQRGL